MMHTLRPPTMPTPVTTPSAGVSGSLERANIQSSWNSVAGSRSSFSRSRTNSLPSAFSFSRYFACPCSILARSAWYFSSPVAMPPIVAARVTAARGGLPGLGVGVGPDDDDEHAVPVAGATDDGRVAARGADLGGDFRHATPQQAHAHADGVALHGFRHDLERAVTGHGPALERSDGHL